MKLEGRKERKRRPVETITWSCAFPLRFVRTELFDYRGFIISQRARSQFCICGPQAPPEERFSLHILLLKVIAFFRWLTLWSSTTSLLLSLFCSPMNLTAASLSAAQVFLSHLITGSLQPSHPAQCFWSQSWSPSRSVVLLFCGGGMGREVCGGGLWCSRLGLGPPPPSLSVLDEDGGGGGGSLGRGADEGGILVVVDPILVPDLRLWILRHSWQILTCVQLRAGSITGVGAGGGGVVLAPSGSSRIRCGPGPRSTGPVPPAPPPPPPPPPAPPVSGPAPL